jgi:hypothetical protein
MAAQVISNPQNSTMIIVKTMTGKIFEINFPPSDKTRKIGDVKNWISVNHGIAAEYQELFYEDSGKKMNNKDVVLMTDSILNLVIKPMPKFELVVYCYAFFKINAAGEWKVQYLHKALAEACNFQSVNYIEIDVMENNGSVRRLERSSERTLSQVSIDVTCTLKVYRMLHVEVTNKVNSKKLVKVRVHNKFETAKDLLKKLRNEYKFRSAKPKLRCKGEIVSPETRLVELSFEKLECS